MAVVARRMQRDHRTGKAEFLVGEFACAVPEGQVVKKKWSFEHCDYCYIDLIASVASGDYGGIRFAIRNDEGVILHAPVSLEFMLEWAENWRRERDLWVR